jgi:hypothetical protein
MEAQSQSIKISLDKLANTIPNEKSKSMTVEEKAKAYDQKS